MLKHSTSMDTAKLMLSWLEKIPDGANTRTTLTLAFEQMARMAGHHAAEAADNVKRLIKLLPNAQKYGAP